MTVRVYYSDDSGAPVLSGTAGALLDVLKACLVNGYGSIDPLGWSEEFTGTNVSVFRAPQGRRYYLRIQDDGAVSTTYTEMKAVWIGYQSMTDIDTGTDAFGLATYTQGSTISKSDELSTTTRPWILVGDEYCFHLFTYPDADNPTSGAGYFFGDAVAYGGHLYSTLLYGDVVDGDPTGQPVVYNRYSPMCSLSATGDGMFWARAAGNFDGTTVNMPIKLTSTFVRGYVTSSVNAIYNVESSLGKRRWMIGTPNSSGVGVIARPVYAVETPTEATSRITGAIPGLYDQLTVAPAHRTLITNVTGMTDRVFLTIGVSGYYNASNWAMEGSASLTNAECSAMIDITGPWR